MIDEVIAMDMSVRYHILPNQTGEGIILLDFQTGKMQCPICWQDLSAYYNYLVYKGYKDEAQQLLADSMEGKKPITQMIQMQIRIHSNQIS